MVQAPRGQVAKVGLTEMFGRFDEAWSPKVVGEVNDAFVKLAKFRGDFVWHHHDQEDELFLVVRGEMRMKLRDPEEREVVVGEGEFVIVPRGVEHLPGAVGDETWVLMLEPKTTLNTGNLKNERTVEVPERLEP